MSDKTVTEKIIMGAFETFQGDDAEIMQAATGCTPAEWTNWQLAKGAGAGAALGLIPVLSYVTIPGDVAYAIRLMHRTAQGICAIRLGYCDAETFAGCLATWTGELTKNDGKEHLIGKAALKGGAAIGGQVGTKMVVKSLLMTGNLLAGKQIAPKIVAMVATRLAAQLATKTATRWIPIISAIASGGINAWIINNMDEAAMQFCDIVGGSVEPPPASISALAVA